MRLSRALRRAPYPLEALGAIARGNDRRYKNRKSSLCFLTNVVCLREFRLQALARVCKVARIVRWRALYMYT
jgi:hypothetical protein